MNPEAPLRWVQNKDTTNGMDVVEIDRCLRLLAYSIGEGKRDAAKSPRMFDATFMNLGLRVRHLRDALLTNPDISAQYEIGGKLYPIKGVLGE